MATGDGWWTFTRRGYRLTPEGSAGLARQGINQRAGTYVSQKKLIGVRDDWIASRKPIADDLAAQLKAGAITPEQWVLQMREGIKTTHISQYVLGRGGADNMTQSDWGRLGQKLREQYGYLNDFGQQIITNPDWSDRYIASRAQMYFEASGTSFEVANAISRGLPIMPEYPGDGRQICLTNCKCYWAIREFADRWECAWTLQATESCPSCIGNAQKWNPLIIPKIEIKTRADLILVLDRMREYEPAG